MRSARAPRLDTLTGMRFVAALGVIIFHLPTIASHGVLGYRWWQFDYIGMPFFFALSGFVLVWTHPPGDTPRAFWRRRFARIYPLYLVCLLPGIVLGLGHQMNVSVISVVLSVPMLQAWVPTTNVLTNSPSFPAWSMSAEMFMYAVFPLLILLLLRCSGRRLLQVLIGVFVFQLVALIVVDQIAPNPPQPILYFIPAYQVGTFIAGMVLAKAVQRGMRFPSLPVASLIAFALYVALGFVPAHVRVVLNMDRMPWMEFFATPVALLVIGSAAQADIAGAPSIFRARPLVTLGLWSYAMYLIQGGLFGVLLVIFPSGFSSNSAVSSVECVALILVAIGIAGLAHRLIEVPLEKRLRHAPRPIVAEPDPAYAPAG